MLRLRQPEFLDLGFKLSQLDLDLLVLRAHLGQLVASGVQGRLLSFEQFLLGLKPFLALLVRRPVAGQLLTDTAGGVIPAAVGNHLRVRSLYVLQVLLHRQDVGALFFQVGPGDRNILLEVIDRDHFLSDDADVFPHFRAAFAQFVANPFDLRFRRHLVLQAGRGLVPVQMSQAGNLAPRTGEAQRKQADSDHD